MLLYQEQLGGGSMGLCGATLISKDYAITAAHCIAGSNPSAVTLTAGMHNRVSTSEGATRQVRTARTITVHPNYDTVAQANDIAVIRLNDSFVFNTYVQPACLPGGEPQPDEDVVIAGWGKLSTTGSISDILQQTYSKVVRDCERWWSQTDGSRQICVSDYAKNSSACFGDSGGPILAKYQNRYVVSGVASFVDNCRTGAGNYPNVYTRVAAYKDWIKSITG